MISAGVVLADSHFLQLSVMASVFPLEVYEHIIELGIEVDSPRFGKRWIQRWSLVCRAWRLYCLPLLIQTMRFRRIDLPGLYAFRRQVLARPDLAALVQVIEVENPWAPYVSELEVFPVVLYGLFPRLRRINIFLQNGGTGRTFPHRYFRVSHLRFESVTELLLRGLVLRHTSELDIHLAMFPRLRTLYLTNVYWEPEVDSEEAWPCSPRSIPSITDLQFKNNGGAWVSVTRATVCV